MASMKLKFILATCVTTLMLASCSTVKTPVVNTSTNSKIVPEQNNWDGVSVAVDRIDTTIGLEKDTSFDVSELTFGKNGQIITNGHTLRIVAKRITVEADRDVTKFPAIVSFEAAPNEPGLSGKSAADIYIFAEDLSGASLTIVNSGQDGSAGAKGAKGTPGKNGQNGQGRRLEDARGCRGRSSKPGGRGGTGQTGQSGGHGGHGGDIVFSITNGSEKLTVLSFEGGDGAVGGPGGDGGKAGKGGSKGTGKSPCKSKKGSKDGQVGKRGKVGSDGTKGVTGRVLEL